LNACVKYVYNRKKTCYFYDGNSLISNLHVPKGKYHGMDNKNLQDLAAAPPPFPNRIASPCFSTQNISVTKIQLTSKNSPPILQSIENNTL